MNSNYRAKIGVSPCIDDVCISAYASNSLAIPSVIPSDPENSAITVSSLSQSALVSERLGVVHELKSFRGFPAPPCVNLWRKSAIQRTHETAFISSDRPECAFNTWCLTYLDLSLDDNSTDRPVMECTRWTRTTKEKDRVREPVPCKIGFLLLR